MSTSNLITKLKSKTHTVEVIFPPEQPVTPELVECLNKLYPVKQQIIDIGTKRLVDVLYISMDTRVCYQYEQDPVELNLDEMTRVLDQIETDDAYLITTHHVINLAEVTYVICVNGNKLCTQGRHYICFYDRILLVDEDVHSYAFCYIIDHSNLTDILILNNKCIVNIPLEEMMIQNHVFCFDKTNPDGIVRYKLDKKQMNLIINYSIPVSEKYAIEIRQYNIGKLLDFGFAIKL